MNKIEKKEAFKKIREIVEEAEKNSALCAVLTTEDGAVKVVGNASDRFLFESYYAIGNYLKTRKLGDTK